MDPNLRVWTWNVGMLRGPAVVAGLRCARREEGEWPHLIGLEEASGTPEALRAELGHLYRVLVAHGWPEADNLVTLVRRDVPVPRWLAVRMRLSWVGPKLGRRKPGRTFHLIDLGSRWRVIHLQRVSGGPAGPNAAAWREEHIRLFRISERRRSRRRRLVIVGDANDTRGDSHHPLSSAGLADAIGGRPVWTGAKVDHAVIGPDVAGEGGVVEHGQVGPEAHQYVATYEFRAKNGDR